MAAPTIKDLENEEEIAQEFLRARGGQYQIFKDDPTAHFDRLWKKEGFYQFVECRQRTKPWSFFDGRSIFIDTKPHAEKRKNRSEPVKDFEDLRILAIKMINEGYRQLKAVGVDASHLDAAKTWAKARLE